jgi:hypothetical protein
MLRELRSKYTDFHKNIYAYAKLISAEAMWPNVSLYNHTSFLPDAALIPTAITVVCSNCSSPFYFRVSTQTWIWPQRDLNNECVQMEIPVYSVSDVSLFVVYM